MYNDVVTVFNYQNGIWYPSILCRVNLIITDSSKSVAQAGKTNADTAKLIVNTTSEKAIRTPCGQKQFLSPKEYAVCSSPADYLTFTVGQDFFYDGKWSDQSPIVDNYESGLYHALNDEYDGVFLITSSTFYGLLPHFEIGGN